MPKKFKIFYKSIAIIIVVFFMKSCVEPYEIETQTFKNMLVVEAAITNEFDFQEIKLSRTVPLEEQVIVWETNADVKIVDDAQNSYIFKEATPGHYVSISKFAAQPNREYHLEIETNSGKSYVSEPTMLIQGAQIDGLKAIRTKNPQGDDGVALVLDSNGNSSYYRYEYEESYKIVSRYQVSQDLVYEDSSPALAPKTKEEYICYGTDASNNIILSSTNSLTENKLSNFLVRFIETGNPKISHRYSILVKQYAIGSEAYTFYQTIKDLSVSESLFSQSQPGFIDGNIYAVNNPEEMVIGFFSISDVATKRIFFNFSDFYQDPRFQTTFSGDCLPIRPTIKFLGNYINSDNFKFWRVSAPPPGNYPFPPSMYELVPAGCVDCTVYGSNKVPEFWIED